MSKPTDLPIGNDPNTNAFGFPATNERAEFQEPTPSFNIHHAETGRFDGRGSGAQDEMTKDFMRSLFGGQGPGESDNLTANPEEEDEDGVDPTGSGFLNPFSAIFGQAIKQRDQQRKPSLNTEALQASAKLAAIDYNITENFSIGDLLITKDKLALSDAARKNPIVFLEMITPPMVRPDPERASVCEPLDMRCIVRYSEELDTFVIQAFNSKRFKKYGGTDK